MKYLTGTARAPLRARVGSCASAMACALALCSAAATLPAQAQAWLPGKGHGSLTLDYEQKQSTKLSFSDGNLADFGKVIDRTAHLNIDYGLSDRWAISVGLPFESNRYTGNDPHDPRVFPFPNRQRFQDDGRYHAGWSDWSVGLRYQWLARPFLVTPYVAYTQPNHTYTYFAHSALGTDQKALQVGVYLGNWFPPPWQNLFWQAGLAYTFEQSTKHLDPLANQFLHDDRTVNHSAISLKLGYNITPRLVGHASIEHDNSFGNGADAVSSFANPDGSPNFNNIFYHDQLFLLRMTTLAAGLDYQLNDHYQLSFDISRTLTVANTHFYNYDANFGISRSF
ncbi:MAG: hypothetical protein JSS44_07565 [Proteobacteria bacterium]|nr:hypothetical protein [Pseudomonadota bacterium]MBS0465377.1 hypothetical protein [Pseudomonadota bacterium]